jgi:hypothetical protein
VIRSGYRQDENEQFLLWGIYRKETKHGPKKGTDCKSRRKRVESGAISVGAVLRVCGLSGTAGGLCQFGYTREDGAVRNDAEGKDGGHRAVGVGEERAGEQDENVFAECAKCN